MLNIDTRLLEKISCDAYWVLSHLAKYLGKESSCFPSKETLKKDTSFGRYKLDNAIKELVLKGLIKKEQKALKDGKFTSNFYTVTTDLLSIFSAKKEEETTVVQLSDDGSADSGSTDVGKPDNKVLSISSEVLVNKEKKIKKEKIKEPIFFFDDFRKAYPGTKRGNETEFTNFKKKHKDWKEVLPSLSTKLEYQIKQRKAKAAAQNFVPQWKNLQTWINNRCWEEEITVQESSSDSKPDNVFRLKTSPEQSEEIRRIQELRRLKFGS